MNITLKIIVVFGLTAVSISLYSIEYGKNLERMKPPKVVYKTVEKEVIKEVPVEKIVEKEIIKEVPKIIIKRPKPVRKKRPYDPCCTLSPEQQYRLFQLNQGGIYDH